MATLQDIADRVGVSHNTVSRVLKGAKYSRPSCRLRAERIRQIAAELGYRPNQSARAMRFGKFQAITLLMSVDVNRSAMPPATLYGVQSAAAAAGMTVNLAIVSDKQLEDESYVPQALSELHSDGLLINYHKSPPPRLLELLSKYRIPSAWLNYDAEFDCVLPDDWSAGRRACEHLLALGHRDIAYIRLNQREINPHYSENARRDGYIKAMLDAGLRPTFFGADVDQGLTGRQNLDLWTERFHRIDRPTAFICYRQSEASLLLAAAKGAGLNPPDDLSLTTFGGTPSFVGLDLDTWVTPEAEMGRAGFEMLLRKIERPTLPVERQLIPFHHESAESVAPPPAA